MNPERQGTGAIERMLKRVRRQVTFSSNVPNEFQEELSDCEAELAALKSGGQHGKTCPKVEHLGGGYLHTHDDDGPYDVDGVTYCGRCHGWLASPAPVTEPMCRRCGAPRSRHDIEQPYECVDTECEGFSYIAPTPVSSAAPMGDYCQICGTALAEGMAEEGKRARYVAAAPSAVDVDSVVNHICILSTTGLNKQEFRDTVEDIIKSAIQGAGK